MRSTVDESLSVTDTQVASTAGVLILTRPVSNRVHSQIMHSRGSRHILVLPLTVCHVCLLRPVSSPCHPCPPDAYATLTGIDYARDRPWEISIFTSSIFRFLQFFLNLFLNVSFIFSFLFFSSFFNFSLFFIFLPHDPSPQDRSNRRNPPPLDRSSAGPPLRRTTPAQDRSSLQTPTRRPHGPPLFSGVGPHLHFLFVCFCGDSRVWWKHGGD